MSVSFRRLARSASRRAVNAETLAEHVASSKNVQLPSWYYALKAARAQETYVSQETMHRCIRRKLKTPEATLVQEYLSKFPEALDEPFDPSNNRAHSSQLFARRQIQLMEEGLGKRAAFNKTLEETRSAQRDEHGSEPMPQLSALKQVQQLEDAVLSKYGYPSYTELDEVSFRVPPQASVQTSSATVSQRGRPRKPASRPAARTETNDSNGTNRSDQGSMPQESGLDKAMSRSEAQGESSGTRRRRKRGGRKNKPRSSENKSEQSLST